MRLCTPALLSSIVLAGLLTGCSLQTSTVPSPAHGAVLRGGVHGGQQPVAGARIYLLAAGAAGYGSASIPLLTSGLDGSDSLGGYVLTATDGSFSIAGDYACTQGQQVYVFALGGDPGAGSNTASGMIAAVGSCPASGSFIPSVSYIDVSELSTIAFAYAVAGFAVDPVHVASSGTALAQTGLANAFATTASLLHGATTPAGNGTVPAAELNTLANILAACVNTDGSLAGGSNPTPCYTLFHNAQQGGTVPSNTAEAAINIAHNPTANVAALFNMPSALSPFMPALTSAPADFSVAIAYTGGGLATSTAQTNQTLAAVNNIAVDAAGNVWKPNYGADTLTALSPIGVPFAASGFSGGGLNQPANVAVDLNGNIWTANAGSSTVSRFSSAGTPASGSPFGAGVLSHPVNLAIDAGNNVWIAQSSTLAKLSNAGVNASGSPFATNTLNGPIGIAIQPGGNVWVSNAFANTLAVYTAAGAAAAGSPYTQGSLAYPYAIAFDASNYGWIANQASITKLAPTGGNTGGSPFASPSGTIPTGLAIDGDGNVWVTDVNSNAILEFSNGGVLRSGNIGFQAGQSSIPEAVAVDGSGNVWYSTYNDATIHQIVGAAAPTAAPLAYALKNSLLGTRP